MKEVFINSSINYLKKNGYNSKEEIEKYTYGLEGLYSYVTKVGFVTIINIILGTWLEFLIFFITYSLIKTFSFGIHAKNNFWCWILTTLFMVGIPLLMRVLVINTYILLITSIVSSVVISIFAPADTALRPLLSKKKRITDKVIATIICIIYLLVILLINNYLLTLGITISLLMEAIMVNPFTYFIFGQSYNNYKDYKG